MLSSGHQVYHVIREPSVLVEGKREGSPLPEKPDGHVVEIEVVVPPELGQTEPTRLKREGSPLPEEPVGHVALVEERNQADAFEHAGCVLLVEIQRSVPAELGQCQPICCRAV